MRLLQRYFWTQALSPLLLALLSLAVLALLTQSLQTLDLIVENRQSAGVFFKITLLALPQLIAIILPLAMFMAALYALNRLNMDSELIVAKAAGASAWQIGSPLLRLASLALIAHLILNLALQPLSFREMRGEILKVRTDIVSQMVQAGQFVSPTPKLTIYAREVGVDGSLLDVLIYDGREAGRAVTHSAKFGTIRRTQTSATLVLQDGSVQQSLPSGEIELVDFENYQLDLSGAINTDKALRLKASDRFLHELLTPDPRDYITAKQRKELRAEAHARLSAPIYNLTLVLLALCFMVKGQHQRLGYGRRIAVCAGIGFVLRVAGFGLTSAAEGTPALNAVQYALPVGAGLLCLAFLLQSERA